MTALVVTVVSGDLPWTRRLEEGLRSRGFAPLVLPSSEDPALLPLTPRPPVLLIDAQVAPYGATELATQLRLFLADRCPALVCMGEPDEPAEDDIFAGMSARPEDPFELLDELERLLPMVTGMESGVVGSGPRDRVDEETG